MAIYWNGIAEFNQQQTAAEHFAQVFNQDLKLSNRTVECQSEAYHSERDQRWYCYIHTRGCSIGGFWDTHLQDGSRQYEPDFPKLNVGEFLEMQKILFERVRQTNHFEFVIFTGEGSEIVYEDFCDLIHERLDGAVLSNDFWNKLGSPANFVPFDKDNVWIPYTDSDAKYFAQRV